MTDPRIVKLAQPFPGMYISDDGRGNDYVPHHIVTQRLIQIFGQPPRIEILREIYDGTDQGQKLTGVVMRLTVPGFDPVEEAGEADNPQSKTNGARLKDACSDAIKRCAMRLGCGLHLWAQKEYFLYDKLLKSSPDATPVSTPQTKLDENASGVDVGSAGSDSTGPPVSEPAEPMAEGSASSATPPAGDESVAPEAAGSLHAIQANVEAKRLSEAKVEAAAAQVAAKHSVFPKDGIKYKNLNELSPEMLDELAQKLKISQGALL